ncbi:MAG: rhamnulokinase [Pleomorphochaeta sp.]
MSDKRSIVAFDCGNSSCRVILGNYENGKITTRIIKQIENRMVKFNEYYHWDILYLYNELLDGLKTIVKEDIKIDSIGICTWGVDFAFFNEEESMISNPCSYRNEHGNEVLNALSDETRENLFYLTGILSDRINSAYLMKSLLNNSSLIKNNSKKVLMVPDILNFFFTGVQLNEPSELSTTQLFDVSSKAISKEACEVLGISPSLFCNIPEHGEKISNLKDIVKEQLEIDYDIPVICVPSHDTAAAILAIPSKTTSFSFISAGTWALIGSEIENPIINEDVISNGFTNELGAFGKITLLKNSPGMFIVQKLKTEYEAEINKKIDWKDIDKMIMDSEGKAIPLFIVTDSRYFNPINMSNEIWNYFIKTTQVKTEKNWELIFSSFNYSMACNFAINLEKIDKINNKKFESVFMVGGGTQNKILCQLTANISKKTVITCGKESTSLGNILSQIKYFEKEKTIEDLRNIISRSIDTTSYYIDSNNNSILNSYCDLLNKKEFSNG